MQKKKVVIVSSGAVISVSCFLWFVLPAIIWDYNTWTLNTSIDGQPAEVTIERRNTRFIGNHVFSIGGGNWRYRTKVILSKGEKLMFQTRYRPRAIWKSDGTYYVACEDNEWFLARLKTNGEIVQVYRRELPCDPDSWNLEPPETQSEMQYSYERWAE